MVKVLKGLLVDIDDTLTNTRKFYVEALEVCHKMYNKLIDQNLTAEQFKEKYLRARAQVHALVPTAAAGHNRAIYFQRMIEELPGETDFDAIYQLYEAYYNHIYSNMKPFPGAENVLKWAKDNKKKVVAVSDGNTHVRIKKIHALGISKYIDYLVSSEEIGVSKPSNQAYLLALHKAGLQPDEVVFIGNRASGDILGANRLDITSIMVSISTTMQDIPSKDEERPTYVVKSMDELLKLLKRLNLH